MKRLCLAVAATMAMALTTALDANAQKVYSVNYEYQADVKVYVVKNEYQADARENKGIWYFTKYSYQADKKVYFTDYEYRADLKVYFTDQQYRAGWKNAQKRHLMY